MWARRRSVGAGWVCVGVRKVAAVRVAAKASAKASVEATVEVTFEGVKRCEVSCRPTTRSFMPARDADNLSLFSRTSH